MENLRAKQTKTDGLIDREVRRQTDRQRQMDSLTERYVGRQTDKDRWTH